MKKTTFFLIACLGLFMLSSLISFAQQPPAKKAIANDKVYSSSFYDNDKDKKTSTQSTTGTQTVVSESTVTYVNNKIKKDRSYMTLDQFYRKVQSKMYKFPNWKVSLQKDRVVFYGPITTILKDHVGHEAHPDPAIERSRNEKKFPSKSYELVISLTDYPIETYKTTKATNERIKKELKELPEKYRVGKYGVYQDEEKGLFTTESKDEKNRLAKYFLAKKHLESLEKDIPDLYIANYGVQVNYINYYRVYPQRVHVDAANIAQMVRNIVEYGDDEVQK